MSKMNDSVGTLLAAAGIGLLIGFLGGMFGKGGSAIATPLLAAAGVPAIIAVAAPLPATIPSTLAASSVYRKAKLIDWRIVPSPGLRRPIKAAFACSLAVAAVLAVPGTIVHTILGHIDWALVAVFAMTSVPLSFLG